MEIFLLKKEEMCEFLKISMPTLKSMLANKELNFPQPFTLSGAENSRDLWIIDDVKAWVRERSKQNVKSKA